MGCDLEAPEKGCDVQKLDSLHRRRDRVTHWHQTLKLEVGKMNFGLGFLAPDWAKRSKSGNTFLAVGNKNYL